MDQQAVASSDQLLGALRQYERAPVAQREALAQRLTQVAAQRRERMLALLERNPKLAAMRTLPDAVRARLPEAARAQVERSVSVQGVIQATIADDFARGQSQRRVFVTDAAGQSFELRTAEVSERDVLSWVGKRATLSATQFDHRLLVRERRQVQLLAADGTSAGGTTQATTAAVQGDRKTLVILASFTDSAMTCNATDVQSRLFGTGGATMNEGYRQSSGGLVSFSGQVVGPYPINYSAAGSCDYNGWAGAAKAAAQAAGVSLSGYQHITIATPRNATCGWSGLATLGGGSSWVQSCTATGVFSHELGHNLQFHHASTPTSEYGDASDPMGNALLVQSNAANRTMAGWTGGTRILDVGAGGTYTIDALSDMSSAGPMVLRLPKTDTAETYYVSLRQGQGVDANLPSGFKGALSVHRATGTLPARTIRVANLTAGQSWADTVNGITITHQGLTATGAAVGVTMGTATCARAAPTISVSPASQSAAPGATLGYAIALTNNNSAACGASSFSLAQSLPAGFSGALGASTVTLAPGAAASVNWNVASATTAADAAYTLTATAAEPAAALGAQSHAGYTVVSAPPPPPPLPPPPDTAPPVLAITNPSSGAVVSGRFVTIIAEASDASGVASVEFWVNGTRLATDVTAPYSVNWNLRKAAAGSHTIRVRATDVHGNAAEKSISVVK